MTLQRATWLPAHVYFEYDGKKGGNNFASLIWKELHRKGLKAGSKAKELNFVFDNCSGQNKNRMVIRLLTISVALGYAKKVVAIFLIRGHTKNDCDRTFNLMKILYRKSNVYTPQQLLQHIETNDKVTCVPVDSTVDFKDFCAFEEKYLSKLPKMLNKHIFTVDSNNDPNKIHLQLADGRAIAPTIARRPTRPHIRFPLKGNPEIKFELTGVAGTCRPC